MVEGTNASALQLLPGLHRPTRPAASARITNAKLAAAALLLAGAAFAAGVHLSCAARAGHGPPASSLAWRAADGSPAPPLGRDDVRHYAVAGEFRRVDFPVQDEVPDLANQTTRSGVLHIYLKALRWPMPDGTLHLRLRGFVAFETPSQPRRVDTFYNVPEVAARLRLALVSAAGGWRRQVPLTLSNGFCQATRASRAASRVGGLDACLASVARTVNVSWWSVGHLRLDLGPADAADTSLALEVNGWPRSVPLRGQLLAALAAPPAQPPAGRGAAPPVVRALPYLGTVPADALSRVLEWQDAYHAPLGLQYTLLYVLPEQEAGLLSHRFVRAQVAAQRLALVRWDGWPGYKGWRDHDLQVQMNHMVLMLWGRAVLALLGDLDELVVPGTAGDTLPRMLAPGGCLAPPGADRRCLRMERVDLFPRASGAATQDEPDMWLRRSGANPLRRYRFMAPHRDLLTSPKMLLDPEAVAAVAPHVSSVCAGERADVADRPGGALRSECSTRLRCSQVDPGCAYVGHVFNMLVPRSKAANTSRIAPADWLWMLRDR